MQRNKEILETAARTRDGDSGLQFALFVPPLDKPPAGRSTDRPTRVSQFARARAPAN